MKGHVHNGLADSELFKSKVVVWIAKILKGGHGLFEIKEMATKVYMNTKIIWCEVC